MRIIQKLRSYKNVTFPVLSVYLTIPKKVSGEELAEKFVKLLQQKTTRTEQELLRQEIQTIEAYLKYTYHTRRHEENVTIFAGERLWEIIHHNFGIPPQIIITHHPFITPLLQQLYNEGEDLVIIADKKYAKILLFHNGIIQKQETIVDSTVSQKIKANKGEQYARNSKLFRHILKQTHDHFAQIAQSVNLFVKNEKIHSVFIGGHTSTMYTLENSLSPNLRKKIKAEFIISPQAPQKEIVRKSQHAIAHAAAA